MKVETELNEGVEIPKREEGAEEAGETGGPDEKPAGGEEGQADPQDVGEWTPEEFAKLDEGSQARIKSMQGIIDKFEPYMDGSLDEGLRIIEEDPIIKARIEEIKGNGEYSMPSAVSGKFDVSNYLSEEDSKHFNMLDEKGKASLASSLHKAFEDGAKNGQMVEQYNSKNALLREQRVHTFTRELTNIVSDNPSMKVPVDSEGNQVPFKDPSHPMNPYLKWAAANMSDDQIAKIGHKAGYAAFLASTGQQDKAMENVAKSVRTSFLKSIDNLDKTIATTAPSRSQAPAGQGSKVYNGIDLNKYKADPGYRRQVFDGADQKTRTKLEQFIFDDQVPVG